MEWFLSEGTSIWGEAAVPPIISMGTSRASKGNRDTTTTPWNTVSAVTKMITKDLDTIDKKKKTGMKPSTATTGRNIEIMRWLTINCLACLRLGLT